MNRDTILEALKTEGHEQFADEVTALVQPAMFIRTTKLARRPPWFEGVEEDVEFDEETGEALPPGPSVDEALPALPLGASRFGGLPDMPPGAVWPVRDSIPMEFVAQIRLADVSGMDPLARLPQRGSLLFFYNSQWQTTDYGEGVCAAVLFHDGDDDALVRTAAPRVPYRGEYDPQPRFAPFVHGLAALSFSPFECVPGGESPFITGPLAKVWIDFCAVNDTRWAPQGAEPYMSNRLLGYIDGQDQIGAHQNGTADQLLLQVDSDRGASFRWGDMDRLYFVLTKAELAARDFSKVRIYQLLG